MVNPPDNDHSDDDIFKYITFGDTPSPQPVASSSSTTFSSLLLPNNQDDEERLRQVSWFHNILHSINLCAPSQGFGDSSRACSRSCVAACATYYGYCLTPLLSTINLPDPVDPSLESQLTAIEAEYDPHPGISKTIGMEPPAAAAERQDAVKSSLVVRAPTRARPTPYPVGSKARSRKPSVITSILLTQHLICRGLIPFTRNEAYISSRWWFIAGSR